MADETRAHPGGCRVFRHEVPVDDQWHRIGISGPLLHVAARSPEVVELWTIHTGVTTFDVEFRVFGTGQPLPDGVMRHVGTALTAGGRLVWHLFERNADHG